MSQEKPSGLPFSPGERLTFVGRLEKLGNFGRGLMTVQRHEPLRGRPVVRLDFRFRGGVFPARVSDDTASWLDPGAMTSLRYRKDERHPLGSRMERVDIHPEEGRWAGEGGSGGRLMHPHPLDELSFLYFIRTLELAPDEEMELERHFDERRNPVRLLGGPPAVLEVPAGRFRTRPLRMIVHDEGRFGGRGRVDLDLAEQDARFPVRIATHVPVAGRMVLELHDVRAGGGW